MLINPYALHVSGGGGGGPPYADVVLLMHCDTDLLDSSSFGTTINAHSAFLDTTSGDPKFGAGCCTFGHYEGYLNSNIIGSGDPLDLSSSDYTMEAWFNPAEPNGDTLFSTGGYNSTTTPVSLQIISAGVFGYVDGEAIAGPGVTSGYHHVALVRASNVAKVYVDGIGGSPVSVTPITWVGVALGIGGGAVVGGANYWGNVDEIRVSKFAVYTENFTPPPAAFPNM
jgi:hypothetical protein